MIESLIGLLVGNLSRLGIEYFRQSKAKKEAELSLQLLDKQIALEKLRLAEIGNTSDATKYTAQYGALTAATNAQAVVTGTWVDAVSASVRPLVTYIFVGLYCAGKVVYSVHTGQLSWTREDGTIFASIISFWFVDRAIRK